MSGKSLAVRGLAAALYDSRANAAANDILLFQL